MAQWSDHLELIQKDSVSITRCRWPLVLCTVLTLSHSQYGSPAVASGTFTQIPIANGTYINGTHWTYTFLCSKCIQADSTTFLPTDEKHNFGFALNAAAPPQKTNASSPMSKHSQQGQAAFDLTKARSKDFATWKTWATTPKVAKAF